MDAAAGKRILILTASIGEGHDLPARVLAQDLEAEAPGTRVTIEDAARFYGWPLATLLVRGSSFHSEWGNRLFDFEHWLLTRFPPARWFASTMMVVLGRRGTMDVVATSNPDVIVSTYPGNTEILGGLRRRGLLDAPVVSAITDLASLLYWANPDVDVHLITHPESVDEVRQIAPRSEIVPVRGLYLADFALPRDRLDGRRALGLPEDGTIVIVSGGGWAVGDLEGAVATALEVSDGLVVVLCGRNEDVQRRIEGRFGGQARVRAMGFTDQMSDLLAAADVLVHSTAGLTVLEALIRGCRVISYGWGRGHIRANNAAFERFGIADVATDRAELAVALRRALAEPRAPDLSFAQLPTAASIVLDRAG